MTPRDSGAEVAALSDEPAPLDDGEIEFIRLWTKMGDQTDKGKTVARALLDTVDRLRARERELQAELAEALLRSANAEEQRRSSRDRADKAEAELAETEKCRAVAAKRCAKYETELESLTERAEKAEARVLRLAAMLRF